MSDLIESWNAAKADLHKTASKGKAALSIVESIAGKAKKGLPAPAVETAALSKIDDSLSAVGKKVDGAAPKIRPGDGAKPVKGKDRTVGTPVPTVSAPGYGGATVNPRPPMKTLKGHWNGLGDTARGAIAGTAIAGTAGIGGHALGRSSGEAEGLQVGATKGFDDGLQVGAQQANSFDPGFLGRLMEVFTGRSAAPMDTANAQMQAARQAAIQRILSGGVKSASAKKLLAAAGIGAVGGGAIGGSIGNSVGFGNGAAQGYDAGVAAPPAPPSVDPGLVARLLEVFTGRQDTAQSLRDTNINRVIKGELVNGKAVTP